MTDFSDAERDHEYKLGIAAMRVGEIAEARRHLREATRSGYMSHAHVASAHYLLAMIYWHLGNERYVTSQLMKAQEALPEVNASNVLGSLAAFRDGRFAEARALFLGSLPDRVPQRSFTAATDSQLARLRETPDLLEAFVRARAGLDGEQSRTRVVKVVERVAKLGRAVEEVYHRLPDKDRTKLDRLLREAERLVKEARAEALHPTKLTSVHRVLAAVREGQSAAGEVVVEESVSLEEGPFASVTFSAVLRGRTVSTDITCHPRVKGPPQGKSATVLSEHDGPNMTACPLEVLNVLTPLGPEQRTAAEWRSQCRTELAEVVHWTDISAGERFEAVIAEVVEREYERHGIYVRVQQVAWSDAVLYLAVRLETPAHTAVRAIACVREATREKSGLIWYRFVDEEAGSEHVPVGGRQMPTTVASLLTSTDNAKARAWRAGRHKRQ